MGKEQKMVMAVAWYNPEQWEDLRRVSVDADKLEKTFSEWKAGAEKQLKALRAQGYDVQKVEVDVLELTEWCKRDGRPVDGEARVYFAISKLKD